MKKERLLFYLDRILLMLFFITLGLIFLRPSWLKLSTPLGNVSLTSAKNPAFAFSCLWLLAALVNPRRYLTRSGLERPLLLFLAVSCLSAALSRFGTAAERWVAVLEISFYCAFLYAVLYLFRNLTGERSVALMLFSFAVAVAALNLAYHYKRGIWVILDQGYPFWDGKNALGLFMVIALSLGASLITPAPAEGERPLRRWWRLTVVLSGLFLIFLCLVYSYSRGAWLAAIGAAAAFGVMRSWKWIALLLAALLVLVFLPHQKAFHRFRSIPRMADGNVAKRVAVWKTAAAMVRAHPLVGVGPGEFRTAYGRFDSRAAAVGADRPKETLRYREHAHNLFLQAGAETGILGLAALVWGLSLAVAAAVTRLKVSMNQAERALVKSALAAIAAFLVFSCVDCSWTGRFSGSSFMHINLIVALLVAMLLTRGTGGSRSGREPPLRENAHERWPLSENPKIS